MRGVILVACLGLCAGLHPPAAWAQTEGLFAVGAGVTRFDPPADNVASSWGIGVVLRRPAKAGWGPTLGLGWYESDLFALVDGREVRVGRVRIRPILAGYGYTWIVGRAALSASALGGYSANSARLTSALQAERDVSGADHHLDAKDSFALRPTFSVGYSVTPRIGLVGSAAAIFSHPDVRLTMHGRPHPARWNTTAPMLSVSVVYSFF